MRRILDVFGRCRGSAVQASCLLSQSILLEQVAGENVDEASV